MRRYVRRAVVQWTGRDPVRLATDASPRDWSRDVPCRALLNGNWLTGHAYVLLFAVSDHHKVEQIALQREHDVFFRSIGMFPAQARRDIRILDALPHGL